MLIALLLVSAYLLGSLSSAVLSCRLLGHADPRTLGSKNPGASNVLRTAGPLPALLTLIGDLLKGMLPVWFGMWLGVSPPFQILAVMMAVWGHSYPAFFQLRGGKGVATCFGGLLAVHPLLAIGLLLCWGMGFGLTGYSSVGALLGAVIMPWLAFHLVEPAAMWATLMLSLFIIWRHHNNILRLYRENEPSFFSKKP